MSLKAFLHQLQFDPDKVKPLDWHADWDDAPLPYKLYRRLPTFPLCAEVPLTLDGKEFDRNSNSDADSNTESDSISESHPSLRDISHFLWYVYGLTTLSQTVGSPDSMEEDAFPLQMYRRFLPSGGGLYPNELYMYLKLEHLPLGVYHYDVAHHRLVLLREGNFDTYLSETLGNRCEVPACFGVAFVSTMFWKNFFKYNQFSYRLQGLDAGVLIGQLLEVAKRFRFEASVYFQFLDLGVNHLLGLSQQEESVYAVIPLSTSSTTNWFTYGAGEGVKSSSASLIRELPLVQHEHYVRSRKVLEYPMLERLNEASLMEHASLFRVMESNNDVIPKYDRQALPKVERLSYDLASACRNRYSPEADYVLSELSLEQLAALLQGSTASFLYRNDLDGGSKNAQPRVSLFGCFYGMKEIANGAYRYNGSAHALEKIREGDHRAWLQSGMSLDNVNLSQVPLCMHVAGDISYYYAQLGYRGYRIQQMEAGMLVQRLLLEAASIGLGGRPLLGYDANVSDDIYKMSSQEITSLIQIPIGAYRRRSRLEGSLGG